MPPPHPAPPCTAGSCFKPLSLIRASPQGLDQDWSAIAATQCRLDKEGATKLVCDLITSTKNEKIFQESIGLAIRLLDGGNTEIQVGVGQKASSSEGAPCLGPDHGWVHILYQCLCPWPCACLYPWSCSPASTILSFQSVIFLAFSPPLS